ncbi:PorT family protein [Mucilaginibacter dorajii]|uniref:Outer membrane protein beta-barrel domain-containing protein n=1 Tax=Mucilaginibacter dorajii TaxID=692994 RepID=A0ABP7QTB6_9SPHI|nr:PorT family protein [Mucilaginibacter dorajii]MCS3736273.1 hypothetical protein [Mucilaginibacter dorajii]
MKNSLNYLNLWQQKRNELPVTDSVQTDWMQMQSQLDILMPVTSAPTSPKSTKTLKASKILKTIKAFKTLILLVSTSAIFFTGLYIFHHSHKIKHNQQEKQHKKQPAYIITDSLKTVDSLNRIDSLGRKPDSLSLVNSPLGNSNSSAANKSDSTSTNRNLAGNRAGTHENRTGQTASPLNKNAGSSVVSRSQNAINRSNAGNHNNYINQVTTNKSATNGSNIFSLNNNGLYSAGGALGYQNGSKQNKGYQPLVLAANFQTSQHLIPNLDSVQADVNNYFTQPALSNRLLPSFNANQNNYPAKQSSAAINAIVSKIRKAPTETVKTTQKDKNGKKEKTAKPRSASPINMDWGLLAGTNSSGSFTPKKQNSNFYGSLPVDLNFGLYGTYHINDKWAINVQARALNPQNISGSYSHANGAKADSGAVDSGKAIKVTDSRKAYFVSVPIHLVYRVNNYLSIKGGPVINIPVKQLAGTTSLTPLAIKKDTSYYTSVTNQLKNTRYTPAINFSLSVGVALQYNRFSFEATYLKSISGYKVNSDFGSYKSNPGSIQLGIGFQLNKPKNR